MTEKNQKQKTSPKKAAPTSPKGMRDILSDEYFLYQGFFEKAAEIALYYGFKPIETPILEKEEIFTSGVGTETDIVSKEMYTFSTKGRDRLALRPEGTASIMRAYLEHGMNSLPQPVMLFYYGPFFRHERPQRGRARQFFQFGIETIGSEQPINDALTIRLTHLMLEEAGIKNLSVLVNSIGDHVCRPHYIRELTNYYRKHINKICPNCRMRLKKNPLRLLDCKEPYCKDISKEAPSSVAFLCEGCKRHFKEVLEHLEAMGIPYRIEHGLVRGIDYYTRTVFEIIREEDEKKDEKIEDVKEVEKEKAPQAADPDGQEKETGQEPPEPVHEEESTGTLSLGGGGRYDALAKALGSKRNIPAVGAAIGVDRVVSIPNAKIHTPRIIKKPKVYFIQLGAEAKLKSLVVIEELRAAKIPIAHSISKDRLSSQLGIAEKTGIPYIIILGQKEANENAVIVRNMQTRSQETVPIKKLGDYLKKHI